jgi:hypothetical protein
MGKYSFDDDDDDFPEPPECIKNLVQSPKNRSKGELSDLAAQKIADVVHIMLKDK